MKGTIIVSKFWTRFFSLGKANAVTIFPFIFVQHPSLKNDKILINHERIHIRQALELLVIPFYLWYLLEFVVYWMKYRDFHKAYMNISFEQEAYQNERYLDYLSKRRFWSFTAY